LWALPKRSLKPEKITQTLNRVIKKAGIPIPIREWFIDVSAYIPSEVSASAFNPDSTRVSKREYVIKIN